MQWTFYSGATKRTAVADVQTHGTIQEIKDVLAKLTANCCIVTSMVIIIAMDKFLRTTQYQCLRKSFI
jgi:hypothetical protein